MVPTDAAAALDGTAVNGDLDPFIDRTRGGRLAFVTAGQISTGACHLNCPACHRIQKRRVSARVDAAPADTCVCHETNSRGAGKGEESQRLLKPFQARHRSLKYERIKQSKGGIGFDYGGAEEALLVVGGVQTVRVMQWRFRFWRALLLARCTFLTIFFALVFLHTRNR